MDHRNKDKQIFSHQDEDSSCHIMKNDVCKEQLIVNSIKLFHLNIQGIRDKIDSLNMFLNCNKFDIICLSEHWIKQKTVLNQMNIYGYRLVSAYCRPSKIHGGVCVFVKKNITCKVIDVESFSVEACAEFCALELSQQNIIVIVVYRSCLADVSIFFEKFEELLYSISGLVICEGMYGYCGGSKFGLHQLPMISSTSQSCFTPSKRPRVWNNST
ncbi:unnamed protein product [Callosobruchus maculatus]|uniref:Endonuclease/exonuclease/phosphatase domain-containing protein n=1 Tax=Callosobruchus maculatus TaxID=64391 RepID=A0A653BQV6_CALMS|nr:unnamed protein product [Callosobruchus maculatus]